MTVEIASLLAATTPGGLAARRAVYAVLVLVAAIAAFAANRRRTWLAGRAGRAALTVGSLVLAVATAALFIGIE